MAHWLKLERCQSVTIQEAMRNYEHAMQAYEDQKPHARDLRDKMQSERYVAAEKNGDSTRRR